MLNISRLIQRNISSIAGTVLRNARRGVFFSDGVGVNDLAFNAGSIAEIRVAAQRTKLVVSEV